MKTRYDSQKGEKSATRVLHLHTLLISQTVRNHAPRHGKSTTTRQEAASQHKRQTQDVISGQTAANVSTEQCHPALWCQHLTDKKPGFFNTKGRKTHTWPNSGSVLFIRLYLTPIHWNKTISEVIATGYLVVLNNTCIFLGMKMMWLCSIKKRDYLPFRDAHWNIYRGNNTMSGISPDYVGQRHGGSQLFLLGEGPEVPKTILPPCVCVKCPIIKG